jgi:hypothetical protein
MNMNAITNRITEDAVASEFSSESIEQIKAALRTPAAEGGGGLTEPEIATQLKSKIETATQEVLQEMPYTAGEGLDAYQQRFTEALNGKLSTSLETFDGAEAGEVIETADLMNGEGGSLGTDPINEAAEDITTGTTKGVGEDVLESIFGFI